MWWHDNIHSQHDVNTNAVADLQGFCWIHLITLHVSKIAGYVKTPRISQKGLCQFWKRVLLLWNFQGKNMKKPWINFLRNVIVPNSKTWTNERILRDELLTKSRNQSLVFQEYIQNCECTGNAVHIQKKQPGVTTPSANRWQSSISNLNVADFRLLLTSSPQFDYTFKVL